MQKNSFLIWIPSIQTYLRFYELDNDQYRMILKVLDDKKQIEFFYQLNKIIKDNLISSFDTNELTIVDRFIICVFLKMNSCSPAISLSRVCDKCGATTTFRLELDALVKNLAPHIDKKFTSLIKYNDYSMVCDLPSIKTEYDIYEYNLMNGNIDECYLLSFIRKLNIGSQQIDFDGLSLTNKNLVFSSLPGALTDIMRKSFIEPIHNSISTINLVDTACINISCKERFIMNVEINYISDLIRLIFRDGSINSLMMDLFNLSSAHISSDFIMQISPSEAGILAEYVRESNKPVEKESPKNQRDLFESPSEFGGF